MSFLKEIRDIIWSRDFYSTRDLMSNYSAPLLVQVTQGHCGMEDTDSLGQGQVIRIHRWLRQQRVIAVESRGRCLSIPLDFDILFEVLPDRKRSLSRRKTMCLSLAEIIRQYDLPKKVRFSPSSLTASQALDGVRLGVRMTLEPLNLIRLHQEFYLNGNAVNFGELDPYVLSIPIHHDMEMSLAQGLASGERNWRRLMRELDNVVAKRVRFAVVQGNKEITVYTPEMDSDNIRNSPRNRSVVQKRHQSLGRAFYYGTLQKIKAADKETKPRPASVSVDNGSLARSGNTQPEVRGTNRRFAKRKEARLNRGIDRVDAVSLSGTSTSATSMTESNTDETGSEVWSINHSKIGADFDDDISDIVTDDDSVTAAYMGSSLFGSVSRLSLFRPNMWSGRDTMEDDAGHRRHQAKGWTADKRRGRLSSATSLSMNDIGEICNGLGYRRYGNQSLQRGVPDGRSLHSSGVDDEVEEIEDSTDL